MRCVRLYEDDAEHTTFVRSALTVLRIKSTPHRDRTRYTPTHTVLDCLHDCLRSLVPIPMKRAILDAIRYTALYTHVFQCIASCSCARKMHIRYCGQLSSTRRVASHVVIVKLKVSISHVTVT